MLLRFNNLYIFVLLWFMRDAETQEGEILTLDSFGLGSDIDKKVPQLETKARLDLSQHPYCEPNIFHPAGANIRIKSVENFIDCTILCEELKDCFLYNYLSISNQCFLFNAVSYGDRLMETKNSQFCFTVNIYQNKTGVQPLIKLPDGDRPSTCGQPNSFPQQARDRGRRKKIIQGTKAEPYSLPWMVSLRTNRGNHFCGASIISTNPSAESSRFLLTAAHCFVKFSVRRRGEPKFRKQAKNTVAYAGSHDLRFSEAHEQSSFVSEIVMHPDYAINQTKHDIAVLVLAEAFEFNWYVRHICLPDAANQSSAMDLNGEYHTAGWGLRNNELLNRFKSTRKESNVLKIADVNLCKERNTTIVAKAEDSADGGRVNKGDSGGPLFCRNIDEGFTIIGVVIMAQPSSLPLVCVGGLRTNFARVSFYANWIQQTMRNNP